VVCTREELLDRMNDLARKEHAGSCRYRPRHVGAQAAPASITAPSTCAFAAGRYLAAKSTSSEFRIAGERARAAIDARRIGCAADCKPLQRFEQAPALADRPRSMDSRAQLRRTAD